MVQDFFTDSLRAEGTTATWLSRAITVFSRSYEHACYRIKSKTTAGLVSDYRSYEIHAKLLRDHLTRLEKKGPVIPESRQSLESALRDIEAEIVRRTRESSLDIAKGSNSAAFQTSIFDRTSSSSDTGPETPGPYDKHAGVNFWGTDARQLESPLSIKGGDFTAKFPKMPDVDTGYDTDQSSNPSTSMPMRGSHHPSLSASRPASHPSSAQPGNPDSDSESWTVVSHCRPRSRTSDRQDMPSRSDLHRTTRALESSRYHDHAGAFRAMTPSATDPRVSRESVLGVIHRVGSKTDGSGSWIDTGWMGRPVSRGRTGTDMSGLSLAEVALGKISKSSPPPGRGGGYIQDRRPRSQKGGSSELLGGMGHGEGWYSEAVGGDTIFTATSSPLSQSGSQVRSSSKPSPRPRPATPAMTSLQRIPYYIQPDDAHRLSNPQLHPPQQIQRSNENSPPAFYQQPYPVSDTDLPLYNHPHAQNTIQTPPQYPRRTGPLPIEHDRSATRDHPSSSAPTHSSSASFLYPHAPRPHPVPSALRSSAPTHGHAAGYTSQPVSRDTSGQSGSRSPFAGGRRPSLAETEPAPCLAQWSPGVEQASWRIRRGERALEDGEGREVQEGSPRLGFAGLVERAVARERLEGKAGEGERGRARWNPDAPIFEPRPREVFGSAAAAMKGSLSAPQTPSAALTGSGKEEERAAGGGGEGGGVGMERTASGGVVLGRRLIEFGEVGGPVDWGRKREESRRRE